MAKDYYLVHHGILGMKWGVRRFQNKDGSYTSEGRNRYNKDTTDKLSKEMQYSDFKKKQATKEAIIAGSILVAAVGLEVGAGIKYDLTRKLSKNYDYNAFIKNGSSYMNSRTIAKNLAIGSGILFIKAGKNYIKSLG